MTLELYLFRHGRTSWNDQGRYQGHADVDLDDFGRLQAKAVGLRGRAIDPIAIYTSDLRRCADTAAEISETVNLPLITDERLRERDVGQWSGLTRDEISQRYPEEYARWQDGDETVRPGGGESIEQVIERISSYVETVRSHKSGAVIAVTHAGWIRSAIQWALGNACPRKSLGVPSQASLTVLLIGDDYVTVEAFNDRGHLLSVEAVDQEPPVPRIY